MYNIKEFMKVIEEYAPLEISCKTIERGDYDNSGLIIKNTDTVSKILFSLDLSSKSVERAKQLGCDTIVTHHPAIYSPIKELSFDGQTAPLLFAVKGGINVISMHLNLDMTEFGIDHYLSVGLGGKDQKVLDILYGNYGYGRESKIVKTSVCDFCEKAKEVLDTDKILFYGEKPVETIATFCGGGSSNALSALLKGLTDADTIITSDIPHHVLKELIEMGKNVMIIPHYVAEQYGFNEFYKAITQKVKGNAETFYFLDKRFM